VLVKRYLAQSFNENGRTIVDDISRIARLLGEIGRAAIAELGGTTWWHLYLAIFALAGAFVLKKLGWKRFVPVAALYAVCIAAVETLLSRFVYSAYYAPLDDGQWLSIFLGMAIMATTALAIVATPMFVLDGRNASAISIAVSAFATSVLVWILYLPFAGEIVMCKVAGVCLH
jgi:hypothetical protein